CISLRRRGRYESLGREQGEATRQLQIDLVFCPRRTLRHRAGQAETSVEMPDRFAMCEACGSKLASFEPLRHCTFCLGRTRQVVSKQFGLALNEIGEMLLQHARDTSMQLLAPRAQQGAIGHILHKRMLEKVRGVWRIASAKPSTGVGSAGA